jgi:hypothetical protein
MEELGEGTEEVEEVVVGFSQESGADFTGWNPLSWGARE